MKVETSVRHQRKAISVLANPVASTGRLPTDAREPFNLGKEI